EQYDWLEDTDEEVDEQELEAHYSYMEKIQEVPTADSGTDSEPVEQVQNDAGYNVFANELQHSKQSESVSNTCSITDDSNVTPDSPDITSSNSKNKNEDMTPQFKNDSQSGKFRNQRTVNVVAARENLGSQVVQQSGIQCFNCREYGHFAKECRKPKRVKDSAYHKEKMNNLTVTTMQVNIQFLQQLQSEWSRFVMIVKQQHKLDEVSYHKLFDIMKQYQNEVNELRAEKLARNANPLALVATAQASQDLFY
nr:hypothetical protein [Tanacetum cinerariifolium]